jgi:hypothetical protein
VRAALLVAALLVAVPASAQEPHPYEWSPEHRRLAGLISDGLLGVQLTLDTIHTFRQPDKWAAFKCQSMRYSAALGAAETTKRLVPRTRPDGSDQKSFFSMHTALAFSASGWKVEIGIPIGAGVAYGRMAADKHFLTDVLVGAAAGFSALQLCGAVQ